MLVSLGVERQVGHSEPGAPYPALVWSLEYQEESKHDD